MTLHGSAEQPPELNEDADFYEDDEILPSEIVLDPPGPPKRVIRGHVVRAESPAEQPPAESLRERVARALCVDSEPWPCMVADEHRIKARAVIPIVAADVQRQIAEALDANRPGYMGLFRDAWDDATAFVRSLDLSSPALEEQP